MRTDTASLVQGLDGLLYGSAASGGLGGLGLVFRITTNGVFTPLLWFYGVNGANPQAALTFGSDGNLYGSTLNGGPNNSGTVFQLALPRSSVGVAFTLQSPGTGQLSLTWMAVPGETFQVQYKSGLTSANWTDLGIPITAVGNTASATDSISANNQRFYRVILLPTGQ